VHPPQRPDDPLPEDAVGSQRMKKLREFVSQHRFRFTAQHDFNPWTHLV
jgi:hypothetical protein